MTSTPPLPGSDSTDLSRALSSKQRTVVIGPDPRLTGKSVALPRLQTGGPKLSADMLSDAELATLRRFYAEDYDVFGAKV